MSHSISDLAREFDLTTRAIRFYEDLGLLQPQRTGPLGRNRVYSARDRTRLKLTLRAKRLGLSLTEAKTSSTPMTARATPARSCTNSLTYWRATARR
jgi:DNA-binding transcriptional MerR regulator